MTTPASQQRVDRVTSLGLTVKELIEELKCHPSDAKVFFVSDYGDHAHTPQAVHVTDVDNSDDEGSYLYETRYSRSGLAIAGADEFDECEDDDGVDVVLDSDQSSFVILR